VSTLASEGLQAPNDLAIGADGTVYFTDPPLTPAPGARDLLIGRVWAYRHGRPLQLIADGFSYCNGIAIDLDRSLIVVERQGLMRIAGGERDWIIEHLCEGAGDGFCLDAEGRIYAVVNPERGIKVIEDGAVVELLPIEDGGGILTNCCFGGADGRTLFVTDGSAVECWRAGHADPRAGLAPLADRPDASRDQVTSSASASSTARSGHTPTASRASDSSSSGTAPLPITRP
jgi:sugar lactone lactonase YvrE